VVICASIVATIVSFGIARQWEKDKFTAVFENGSLDRVSAIKQNIEYPVHDVDSLGAFFEASQKVERLEFRHFVQSQLLKQEYVQAFAWVPRVPGSRRAAFVEEARREGLREFEFTEHNAKGEMTRAGKRSEYFPAYYIEPYLGNEEVLGFDLASEAVRREALSRAIDTGKFVATPRLASVQGNGDQGSFLVMRPVYMSSADYAGIPSTVQRRLEDLRGITLGEFKIGDMVEHAMSYLEPAGIDIYIYDLSAPKADGYLYLHRSRLRNVVEEPVEDPRSSEVVKFSRVVKMADRQWQIICTPAPELIAATSTLLPWSVLIFGILITGFIGVAGNNYIKSARRAEIQAEHLRKSESLLRESENKFRNLAERSLVGIYIIQDGLIRYANPKLAEILGYRIEEIVGTDLLMSIVAPEDVPLVRENLRKRLSGEVESIRYELRAKRKDGGLVHVEVFGLAYTFQERPAVMGTLVDITERKKAVELLKESEEKYRSLICNIPDVVWTTNSEGKTTYISPNVEDVYGYTQQEIYDDGSDLWFGRIHPEDKETVKSAFSRLFEDETPFDVEYRIRNKNGEIIWLRDRSTGTYEEGGKKYANGVFYDITQEKRAEYEAKESEDRFKQFSKATFEGIIIIENEKFLDANDRFLDMFGYTMDEIRGLDTATLVLPEDRHIVVAARESLAYGTPIEVRALHKSGAVINIEFRAKPITYKGRPCRIAAIRDVTKRKTAEMSLKASENKYRVLFESAADAIMLMEKDLFIDCNDAVLEMFGCAREDIIGNPPYQFSPHTQPDGRNSTEKALEKINAALGGTPQHFEWKHRRCDGTLFDAEVTLNQIYMGSDVYLQAIVRDVSERKKSEEILRASEERMRLFFERQLVGMAITSPEKGWVKFNDRLCEMMGLTRDELACTTWADLTHPEDLARDKAEFNRLLSGEIDEYSMEKRFIRKDGSVIYANLSVGCVRKPDGSVDYVLALLEDITERTRAYSEIRELKEKLELENIMLKDEIRLEHEHAEFVSNSDAMRKVLGQIEQVATTDSTVLITGETGTGKELIAREIHSLSDRKSRVMMKVNCAAIPSALLESELFGREKGAYTGATTRQAGRFEVADGSTIFLDEIGELSSDMQAKLLRVLQEGEFERLGSTKTIKVDTRVIAATNKDLADAVKKADFREDLYYRLNIFPIYVPPLRERSEDILPLVWVFIREFGEKMGKRIEKVSKKSMDTLQNYSWPGNIRELRNVIERAMIVSRGPIIQIDLPEADARTSRKPKSLEEVERNHILEVLGQTGWRISGENGAAEILGLKPTTLRSRMQKLGIKKNA